MKRKNLINLHLYFSGISLILLLLFIISGSLHLFGVNEGEDQQIVETIEFQGQIYKDGLDKFLQAYLKDNQKNYSFDYTKGNDQQVFTRPTTRAYYSIQHDQENHNLKITQHFPNFNKKMMEFHKGHGPQKARKIVAFIAIIFALAILTGLWLGLTVKSYRKITLACTGTSLLLVIILFNL